jgi:hypothetical protein
VNTQAISPLLKLKCDGKRRERRDGLQREQEDSMGDSKAWDSLQRGERDSIGGSKGWDGP